MISWESTHQNCAVYAAVYVTFLSPTKLSRPFAPIADEWGGRPPAMSPWLQACDIVELEDPGPVTRHLIVRYCWYMDNNSSWWSTTGPVETWSIAKHRHCCLWCAGDCSQNQLTTFRPSQWNGVYTDTTARLPACIPDMKQPKFSIQYKFTKYVFLSSIRRPGFCCCWPTSVELFANLTV